AREARDLHETPVAVCSQRRALCLAALVFSAIFASALLVVYATPQPSVCSQRRALCLAALVFSAIFASALLVVYATPQPPVCSQRRTLCLAALVFSAIFASALLVVYATPQPLSRSGLLTATCPLPGCSDVLCHICKRLAGCVRYATAMERIASNGVVFPWRGARLPTFVVPKHYSLWLHPNLTTGELRGEVSIDLKVDRDTSFVVLNVRDMNVTERALFRAGGAAGPKVAKEKLRRKYNYTLSLRFITKLERNEFATSPPMSPHMMSVAVCRLQRRAAPVIDVANVTDMTDAPDVSTPSPGEEVLPPPEISLYRGSGKRELVLRRLGSHYLVSVNALRHQDHRQAAGAAAGEEAGRAALARLLRDHRSASADARFVMTADPPDPDPPIVNDLLTLDLRADLDELFYEPDEDLNATTVAPTPSTTTRRPTAKHKQPPAKWVIPVTFVVGPIVEQVENITR
ncbi:Uncharacterized protein OBRU01_14566, partial [Operophtera brumata]